ncbi:N-acetyltransferase family protein [Mycobacterium haemophilum]
MTQIPDGIHIRQAEPADYDSVEKMHYPSWRQSYAGILAPHVLDMFGRQNWSDDEYIHRLDRPGWSMWLAEADGQLIGMSIFGPEPENPDHLEIDALYVAVENQRQGVGSALLDHALRSQPADDIVLWCTENNYRARRFYESKGFKLDGRAFTWTLIPGVIEVPQVGYTLYRSARQAEVPTTPTQPPRSPAN